MNQTTRPRRDPPGEQGNKRSSLKTPGVPGALSTHGNNVMVEFPLRLFQTEEEARSFQDLTQDPILLIIPLPSLSRHWVNGGGGEEKREKRECCSLRAPAVSQTSSGLVSLCGRCFLFHLLLLLQLPSQVADKLLSFSCPRPCVTLPLKEMRGRMRAYLCMGNSTMVADADASFFSSCQDCGAAA